MAPHSSTFAWKIPWTEESGRLQSMGSQESDTTERLHFHFSLSTFMHWRWKWQPTPVFLPGESQGRGALLGCRLWGRTESDMTEATQQQQQQQCLCWVLAYTDGLLHSQGSLSNCETLVLPFSQAAMMFSCLVYFHFSILASLSLRNPKIIFQSDVKESNKVQCEKLGTYFSHIPILKKKKN